MPFFNLADLPPLEILPGCRTRIPYGQHLMLSYLEMDPGAEVPLHSHPHEQGGILVSGRLQLTIGDETRVVEAGSLFLIPTGVPHRAVACDGPAVILDVFSPVREDYAERYNKYIPRPGQTPASAPTPAPTSTSSTARSAD
jgi:quercetin dioxygenase-like cupin family protein